MQTPSQSQPIEEIDILWLTAGLSCDGESIALTAATQPSIEDLLLGAIPWIPKVRLHNPVLAMENGDEFLRHFHLAAEKKLGPFILVVEGSIPDETNKAEGYWASFGTDPTSGQPIPTGAGSLGRGSGRHLRRVRGHPCHARQSNRLHGPARLPGLGLEVEGRYLH